MSASGPTGPLVFLQFRLLEFIFFFHCVLTLDWLAGSSEEILLITFKVKQY